MAGIHIHSGRPHLQADLATRLDGLLPAGADLVLVIDAPTGWAFTALEELEPSRTVVVSDNPCPEYRLDLLELEPRALLDASTLDGLREALAGVLAGQEVASEITSHLTLAERRTLRLHALGRSARDIAAARGVRTSTVRNTTHMIYVKLGLSSVVQLAQYYFGLWDVLEAVSGWHPSERIL